jgi:hypothetical protein
MTNAYGMLKAAVAGQDGRGREANDFYPTPPEATRALLPEIADFPRRIWEPACGDGAIAKELVRGGFQHVSTDLVDRGWGIGGRDFLATECAAAAAIVTNPPFEKMLISRFIEHAVHRLRVPYVAILVNVNFWHANSRTSLFDRRRPSAILPLTWRLDFTGSGRPYFNCVWTVWRPTSPADPIYRRLSRPSTLKTEMDLVG